MKPAWVSRALGLRYVTWEQTINSYIKVNGQKSMGSAHMCMLLFIINAKQPVWAAMVLYKDIA